MKSYRKELWFNLPTRHGFINITSQVEEALHENGIREGLEEWLKGWAKESREMKRIFRMLAFVELSGTEAIHK